MNAPDDPSGPAVPGTPPPPRKKLAEMTREELVELALEWQAAAAVWVKVARREQEQNVRLLEMLATVRRGVFAAVGRPPNN